MTEPERHLSAALGRVASGLFVLTLNRADVETGMLASWVQQCSFAPPQVTFCVQRDRAISPCLQPGAVFTLNVLDDTQTDMIVHFGRGFAQNQPAFNGLGAVQQVARERRAAEHVKTGRG